MARFWGAAAVVLVAVGGGAVCGLVTAASMRAVDVYVNGELRYFDPPAVLSGGTTYVPLRQGAEAVGATVEWDDATQTATIRSGESSAEIPASEGLMLRRRLFLPLRLMGEALGCEVKWDSAAQAVLIVTPGGGAVGGGITPDEAIALVRNRPEVQEWLSAGPKNAHIEYDHAEGDDYVIHVYEVVYDEGAGHTATFDWYYVNRDRGAIRAVFAEPQWPTPEDDELVEQAVRARATVRVDDVQKTFSGDWVFVDVAERGPDGNWAASQSLLLRKREGQWKVLAVGDPMDWGVWKQQMTTEVLKDFEKWHAGHF
jgi:hypothetical protein